MKAISLALLGALALTAPASAADILGVWQRSDGKAKIRMSACGDAVCGHIAWLISDKTPAKVGQQVFSGFRPDGGGWSGSAFNPEDGKTYAGKATVSGASMTTKGCALGGLLCKSVTWVRAE